MNDKKMLDNIFNYVQNISDVVKDVYNTKNNAQMIMALLKNRKEIIDILSKVHDALSPHQTLESNFKKAIKVIKGAKDLSTDIMNIYNDYYKVTKLEEKSKNDSKDFISTLSKVEEQIMDKKRGFNPFQKKGKQNPLSHSETMETQSITSMTTSTSKQYDSFMSQESDLSDDSNHSKKVEISGMKLSENKRLNHIEISNFYDDILRNTKARDLNPSQMMVLLMHLVLLEKKQDSKTRDQVQQFMETVDNSPKSIKSSTLLKKAEQIRNHMKNIASNQSTSVEQLKRLDRLDKYLRKGVLQAFPNHFQTNIIPQQRQVELEILSKKSQYLMMDKGIKNSRDYLK